MSLKKFKENDLLINTMKAYPSAEFVIYDSTIYYNSIPEQSGAFSAQVRDIPPGFVSLEERNIDKAGSWPTTIQVEDQGKTDGSTIPFTPVPDNAQYPGANPFTYKFILKDSSGGSFRTTAARNSENPDDGWTPTEWDTAGPGDVLYGAGIQSASISREYITTPFASTSDYNAHYVALKNRLNFYGARSVHYNVSGGMPLIDPTDLHAAYQHWNKDDQILNLIHVPSIFYGKAIYPGTLSLKWYYTGSLIGELQDLKRNGELIQVGPVGSPGSGSVAGVALYDEGILMLTGTWDLGYDALPMVSGSSTTQDPSWIYFGAGAQDGMNIVGGGSIGSPGALTFTNASFGLSFKGETNTQVITMFTHAKRGEANFSNNPTYMKWGDSPTSSFVSSHVYEENSQRLVANTVSSSYTNYSASYQRQVYISRVGIYDENKNLLGVATLSNPILKKEEDSLTFKLKLDI